jgi:hypothetical protein
MTFNANVKALGFKDMHEQQVEAFLRLIDVSLSLAGAMEDDDIFGQALEIAEDAVVLFGGGGIEVKYEVSH